MAITKITTEDNWCHEGNRGAEDEPRAVRWAVRMKEALFEPDWSKWHYTEGSGLHTACQLPVVPFVVDGSPQEAALGKINCKRCLAQMRKHGVIAALATENAQS